MEQEQPTELSERQPSEEATHHKTDSWSPSGVVSEFCQLDMAAVRLGGGDPEWPQLRSLVFSEDIAWPDAQVIIVSDFQVTQTLVGEDVATVSIQYSVLGRIPEYQKFIPEKRTENVDFRLIREDRKWKIESLYIYPHVSREAMIRHLGPFVSKEAQKQPQLAHIPEIIRSLQALEK